MTQTTKTQCHAEIKGERCELPGTHEVRVVEVQTFETRKVKMCRVHAHQWEFPGRGSRNLKVVLGE